jgi:hypothetical protein
MVTRHKAFFFILFLVILICVTIFAGAKVQNCFIKSKESFFFLFWWAAFCFVGNNLDVSKESLTFAPEKIVTNSYEEN